MNAALQHRGRFCMTIQRLQVKPQPQQLFGKAGCEGTRARLHGLNVVAIHAERAGFRRWWWRAFGLQWRRHIDYDGRRFGFGGGVARVLCNGYKRADPNQNQGQ